MSNVVNVKRTLLWLLQGCCASECFIHYIFTLSLIFTKIACTMASKVHRVRYYNPEPKAFNCVAFNRLSKHIALARSNGAIEIWDLNYAPYPIKVIPGVANFSIEALCWVGSRLLSTGLGGALVEWDLDKLRLKTTTLLTGQAAWCLDVNYTNTLVAVGTEQGYVNSYNVDNDRVEYEKLFDKQEGRILCCKFNKSGNLLATGSENSIRIWNVETGHARSRITVSRGKATVIVWSLAFLSDNTIVSGDSVGRLTFWDAELENQIESYGTHQADILAIAVSEDEKSLYCSGVDPLIMSFKKIEDTGDSKQTRTKWVKHVHRHIHEHDVRGLVICDTKLISVGVDGYLTLSNFPPKWVMRIPPMVPAPRSTACKNKLLLLRYNNHLEVWKLGTYEVNKKVTTVVRSQQTKQKSDNKQLEQDSTIDIVEKANKENEARTVESLVLDQKPVKLVQVRAKGNKQIRYCEISPSGEFIVYSTDDTFKILKLELDDEQGVSLSKVLVNELQTCDRAAFAPDSRTLVAQAAHTGVLTALHVDPEGGASVVQTIAVDKHLKSSSILHLMISETSENGSIYLVVADTTGTIVVWTRAKKFVHHVTLPRYHCVPCALTVDCKTDCLIVIYVDQKIVEYDLTNKTFVNRLGNLPSHWRNRRTAAIAVTSHPARPALVVQDETGLWVLERDGATEGKDEPPKKMKGARNKTDTNVKVLPIKYLAGFHWIAEDEAVAVEMLPENIVAQLPDPLKTRKRHANSY